MKAVFVAGSRKFFQEVEDLVKELRAQGIRAETAGKSLAAEENLESERKELEQAFARIDSSDVLYVFSRAGYIGKRVSLEIAYAFAKKKEILCSEEISELSARALVSKIVSPSELPSYLKASKKGFF
ncbi:MAG: hypothetical protein V1847_03750 [Candidatus Diapherotrites archaeon]